MYIFQIATKRKNPQQTEIMDIYIYIYMCVYIYYVCVEREVTLVIIEKL